MRDRKTEGGCFTGLELMQFCLSVLVIVIRLVEDQVRDDAKQVRWRVQVLFYKFLWWSVRLQRYLLGLAVVSLCLMSCDELPFHFSLKMFLTGDFHLALNCQ